MKKVYKTLAALCAVCTMAASAVPAMAAENADCATAIALVKGQGEALLDPDFADPNDFSNPATLETTGWYYYVAAADEQIYLNLSLAMSAVAPNDTNYTFYTRSAFRALTF